MAKESFHSMRHINISTLMVLVSVRGDILWLYCLKRPTNSVEVRAKLGVRIYFDDITVLQLTRLHNKFHWWDF